jgi:hypothetical protein
VNWLQVLFVLAVHAVDSVPRWLGAWAGRTDWLFVVTVGTVHPVVAAFVRRFRWSAWCPG